MDKALLRLMQDYGFRLAGKDLIACGIAGFTSDRLVGFARDPFDAAEQLIWRLRDDSYTRRLRLITG